MRRLRDLIVDYARNPRVELLDELARIEKEMRRRPPTAKDMSKEYTGGYVLEALDGSNACIVQTRLYFCDGDSGQRTAGQHLATDSRVVRVVAWFDGKAKHAWTRHPQGGVIECAVNPDTGDPR